MGFIDVILARKIPFYYPIRMLKKICVRGYAGVVNDVISDAEPTDVDIS